MKTKLQFPLGLFAIAFLLATNAVSSQVLAISDIGNPVKIYIDEDNLLPGQAFREGDKYTQYADPVVHCYYGIPSIETDERSSVKPETGVSTMYIRSGARYDSSAKIPEGTVNVHRIITKYHAYNRKGIELLGVDPNINMMLMGLPEQAQSLFYQIQDTLLNPSNKSRTATNLDKIRSNTWLLGIAILAKIKANACDQTEAQKIDSVMSLLTNAKRQVESR